jgi:hypothetical protein
MMDIRDQAVAEIERTRHDDANLNARISRFDRLLRFTVLTLIQSAEGFFPSTTGRGVEARKAIIS